MNNREKKTKTKKREKKKKQETWIEAFRGGGCKIGSFLKKKGYILRVKT